MLLEKNQYFGAGDAVDCERVQFLCKTQYLSESLKARPIISVVYFVIKNIRQGIEFNTEITRICDAAVKRSSFWLI